MSADSRRLLGLDRSWKPLEGERRVLLRSEARKRAYDRIDTNTIPQKPNIEKKQGIVAEVLEKSLIPDVVLKESLTVYISSASDVAYPLALGARKIVMVDPCFTERAWRDQLANALRAIVNDQEVTEDDYGFSFDFDFGQGEEPARVDMVAQSYNSFASNDGQESHFSLPDQTGTVIFFASHGGKYRALVTDGMRERIVDGGAILQNADIHVRDTATGEWERIPLGK